MATHDAMTALRDGLAEALAWGEARATFEAAVDGLAPGLRGRRPAGFAHSAWELVEHLRRAQHDILDFCRNPSYRAPSWPADYWPTDPAPAAGKAWDESIAAYTADRAALQALVRDPACQLEAVIPHGSGQTYLREIVLVIDHTAYHVGQLIAVRQLLGAWP